MYAIFEDGSRQYRVSVGDVLRIDYLDDKEVGQRVELDRVLLLADGASVTVGQPVVAGARVLARVVGMESEKVYIQHFRRRKNYRRLKGHRQHYLAVKVEHIVLPGQPIPDDVKPTPYSPPAPAAEAPAQEAVAVPTA